MKEMFGGSLVSSFPKLVLIMLDSNDGYKNEMRGGKEELNEVCAVPDT